MSQCYRKNNLYLWLDKKFWGRTIPGVTCPLILAFTRPRRRPNYLNAWKSLPNLQQQRDLSTFKVPFFSRSQRFKHARGSLINWQHCYGKQTFPLLQTYFVKVRCYYSRIKSKQRKVCLRKKLYYVSAPIVWPRPLVPEEIVFAWCFLRCSYQPLNNKGSICYTFSKAD